MTLTGITDLVALLQGAFDITNVITSVDFTGAEPAGPSTGDMYYNTGTGASSVTAQSVTADYVYKWNGTTWTEFTKIRPVIRSKGGADASGDVNLGDLILDKELYQADAAGAGYRNYAYTITGSFYYYDALDDFTNFKNLMEEFQRVTQVTEYASSDTEYRLSFLADTNETQCKAFVTWFVTQFNQAIQSS